MIEIEITFNGKQEKYLVQKDVSYKTALDFCHKNSVTLPSRKFFLEKDKKGKPRWEMLRDKIIDSGDLVWAITSDKDDRNDDNVWFIIFPANGAEYSYYKELSSKIYYAFGYKED